MRHDVSECYEPHLKTTAGRPGTSCFIHFNLVHLDRAHTPLLLCGPRLVSLFLVSCLSACYVVVLG